MLAFIFFCSGQTPSPHDPCFSRLLSRLPCVSSMPWAPGSPPAYLASPTYRRHLRANLVQAGFDPGLCGGAAAAEAGKQALELSRIWLDPGGSQRPGGPGRGRRGTGGQRPGRRAGASPPTPTSAVSRSRPSISRPAATSRSSTAARQAQLQQLIETGRRRENLHIAAADLGSGVRSLKGPEEGAGGRHAARPGTQDRRGVWLDFFGRPAYTMTLAARLTETGATVLMTWGERLPCRGYRIHFSRPTRAFAGDTLARRSRSITKSGPPVPAQYPWGYTAQAAGRGRAAAARRGRARRDGSLAAPLVARPIWRLVASGACTGCLCPALRGLGWLLGRLLYAPGRRRRRAHQPGLCFPSARPSRPPWRAGISSPSPRPSSTAPLGWWASPARLRRLIRFPAPGI